MATTPWALHRSRAFARHYRSDDEASDVEPEFVMFFGSRSGSFRSLALFSSLSGFYEIRGYPAYLEAHFLFPSSPSRITWSGLDRADAQFAFKDRWRLRLVSSEGHQLVSVTWNRPDVESAVKDLTGRRLERSR